MKKRILSLLLVFCLLLPISVFASGQDNGTACFNYLKDYLKANGTLKSGVYTYKGTETLVNDDGTKTSVDVVLTYDSAADALTFGCEMAQALVTYRSEVKVPSALKMPYDAAQHLSAMGLAFDNNGKISSDFTTQSKVALSGETFGTEDVFPYTIALALRHAQDKILTGSGYTIEDLGFSALSREPIQNSGARRRPPALNQAIPAIWSIPSLARFSKRAAKSPRSVTRLSCAAQKSPRKPRPAIPATRSAPSAVRS